MSNTNKISVGDSTRGYDSAEVVRTQAGKYRLVPGSVNGRVSVVRKAVAALNRGERTYVTPGDDYLPIDVS